MKIIFLDFDGVLNHREWFTSQSQRRIPDIPHDNPFMGQELGGWAHMVDPECVQRLNQIIEATDAKVVVSSTWRFVLDVDSLQRILDYRGFEGEIIDTTPVEENRRWPAVEKWLARTSVNVEETVILDDARSNYPNHVHTNTYIGLTDEHVQKAIEVLNGDQP